MLTAAYGPDWLTLIREQYIDGRAKGDALETIRQGVRAGLTLEGGHASESWNGRLAAFSGAVTPEQLDALRQALRQNETMPDDQEAVFSRFELAMDLRLRAAFAEADRRFRADAIRWACAIAILLSVIGFALVYQVSSIADFFSVLPLALIVGVVAVPLAPVSKDLASAISAAAHAARAARGR
ncbi:MAG: hypothetical protein KIS81_08580 [Maricaulaceae bacterium]|nr:hypothetical protein [Maricaulaceae bacterium]